MLSMKMLEVSLGNGHAVPVLDNVFCSVHEKDEPGRASRYSTHVWDGVV